MLSLVNYDDSDDSDEGESTKEENNVRDPVEKSGNVTSFPGRVSASGVPSTEENDEKGKRSTLLQSTKSDNSKTVKISIPSLKEFDDDDDEPSEKKVKLGLGSSGLIGMLPAPRNFSANGSGHLLLPSSLSRRTKVGSNNAIKDNDKKPLPTTDMKASPMPVSHITSSIIDVAEATSTTAEESTDFFNLESSENKQAASTLSTTASSSTLDFSSSQQTWNLSSESTSDVGHSYEDSVVATSSAELPLNAQYAVYGGENVHLQPSYNTEYSGEGGTVATLNDLLQDEGFLRLQGKKQRGREEINVIDVSADQQLSSAQEWLTKSLTEEKVHRPSRRKGEMPTQQQRRKHQITYLAFQAKERELELKNQWAQNRLTKRETQAKYGF